MNLRIEVHAVEILKSQLTIQCTIYNDCTTVFWEILPRGNEIRVQEVCAVEILKSQLATQFAMYYDCTADFWEIQPRGNEIRV